MKRTLNYLLVALLCVCSISSLSGQNGINDEPCCETNSCTGKERCKCPGFEPPDDCYCSSSGTGTGCIEFSVSFPGIAVGNEVRSSQLYFQHEEPSLTMFTPQGLDYISPAGAYLSRIEGDLSEDEVVTVVVSNARGIPIPFEISEDNWIGYAKDAQTAKVFRLELLDAELNPAIDTDPAFVKLVNSGAGSSILLDFATGEAIQETDELGRITRFDQVDIIREDEVIVQIETPGGLIDFEIIDIDFEYEIRFYDKDAYTWNETSGRFELNAEIDPILGATKRFNIKNPAYDRQDIAQTHITRYWDGRVTQWQFQYYTNNDLWELRLGEVVNGSFNLLRMESSRLVESQDETKRTDIKVVYDAEGKLLSKTVEDYELIGFGFDLVRQVEDPDGANLVTEYIHYTTGDLRGELKYQLNPDGSWLAFDHDSEGRMTLKVESWMDVPYDDSLDLTALAALAKATEYSYTPVDSGDYILSQRDEPRTETVRIQGVVTERTWRAFIDGTDGRYREITERATNQSSAYGDASNVRSETIYYPAVRWGESDLRARRIQTERLEDGSLINYDYSEDKSGNFVITETYGYVDASGGVAFKSMQHVKTYDALANLIREEHKVFNGSTYDSVYFITHTYDSDRNLLESRRFDGLATGRVTYEASYSHGKAVSVSDETGRTVHTTYDVLDRKEAEVIEGDAISGVGDIIRSYGYSTSATGCGCSAAFVTIQSADGTLTLTEVNETDRVERATRAVDANGLETTYVYEDGGRKVTMTLPNGSTRITTNYLDGQVKSVTGTGVIPEYYTYGVNADGTLWTRVDRADATYHEVDDISSVADLRYTKITEDMAGRLIAEVSPAFGGGTVASTYTYDNYNRVTVAGSTGLADTLYEYDPVGNIIRSGLDINDNGILDLASEDRITETDQLYQFSEGIWYDQSISKVYPLANDSSSVTITTVKRQLSGFTDNVSSKEITTDIHGNSTTQTTEIDRDNKTVLRTVSVPDSTIAETSKVVNGYLLEQNSTTIAAPIVFGYDALGRLISEKQPRHTQASQIDYYTGTNQIFTRTDASGSTIAYTYYAQGETGAGRIASMTDPLLQKAYYSYDSLNRQTHIWGQTDYPQAYSYNIYGELATLTTYRDAADVFDFSTSTWPNPSGGDVTTWVYDAATGLLIRKEYADGNGTDYAYDSSNRLAKRTWSRDGGLDTDYGYSLTTGELLSVDYEDANTTDITYTYDRLGRQATVTDATGTRNFSYDSATLQLTSETLDSAFYSSHELQRSYDALGRSVGYTLQDSTSSALSTVSYSYEPTTGRLSTVSDGSDSFTYGYNPSSNLLASITAPYHNVMYSHETNRDLMTVIDNQVSGVSLSSYTYSYDSLGRRINRSQSGSAISTTSTDTFGYNDRSEVIGSTNSIETAAEWNPTYSYDAIGNRKSSTGFIEANYTTNSLNQYDSITLDSSPLTIPSYDADGNLLSNSAWTYTWNNENRLQSATDGTTTLNFTYDYQGRLVRKDDGTDIEVYLYDSWNRIATFKIHSSLFTLHSSFLWGLDLSGSMQGAGGVGGLLKEGDLYPTFDANGNITQKLDNEGEVAMSVTYDPFGNIIEGILFGDYGFSTKPLINDLDWYYYGFRYYDPVPGRWPNRDPIEEDGGLNLYGFGYNNPINGVDPDGRAWWTIPSLILKELAKRKAKKCAALQAAVVAACKKGKRKCTNAQDCATLSANIGKNLACAAARDRVNKKCFAGGNPGHRQAANEARKAAAKCSSILAKKKASGKCCDE